MIRNLKLLPVDMKYCHFISVIYHANFFETTLLYSELYFSKKSLLQKLNIFLLNYYELGCNSSHQENITKLHSKG